MLDVRIACPRCHKRLKTMGPPAVGQRVSCPRCKHTFAVSDGGARPSPPERTPPRAANGALAALYVARGIELGTRKPLHQGVASDAQEVAAEIAALKRLIYLRDAHSCESNR